MPYFRGPTRHTHTVKSAIIDGVAEGPLTGRLLVASPWLRDANFARTVVLILGHGDEGALGLVLNRPSSTPVGEAVPNWSDQAATPPYVYVGGPVELSSAICLARVGAAGGSEGWQPLFGRLGTLDIGLEPEDVGVDVERLRVFAGHAGWAAGQLEGEIEAKMWFVLPADPSDALSEQPATLWGDVLRRQPGPLAMVANFPTDLSFN